MARPRRRRIHGLIGLAATTWFLGIIPPARSAEPPITVRRTVASGVRVSVLPRPGSAMVALDIRVRAGSADGPEGVAHAVEHMLFKGTAARASGEIDASMERLGGEIEARTFRDATRFSVVLPRAAWRDGLSLLSELLLRPALRDEDWAIERRVIDEERAWSAADPGAGTTQSLFARLWAEDSAVAASPIGDASKVAGIDVATLRAFHSRWYKGERLSVVVAGDVDPDEVVAATEAFFDGPKATEQHRPVPLAHVAPARRTPSNAVPSAPVLAVGWRIDGAGAQTSALASIAAQWLADELGGPFTPLLSGEASPALAVAVERLPQRGGTLLVARLVARGGREEALARGLADLLATGFANSAPTLVQEARRRAAARWDGDFDAPITAARLVALDEGLDRPGDERLVRKAIDTVDVVAVQVFFARLGSETPLAVVAPRGMDR